MNEDACRRRVWGEVRGKVSLSSSDENEVPANGTTPARGRDEQSFEFPMAWHGASHKGAGIWVTRDKHEKSGADRRRDAVAGVCDQLNSSKQSRGDLVRQERS